MIIYILLKLENIGDMEDKMVTMKEITKEAYAMLKRTFMCAIILLVATIFLAFGITWIWQDNNWIGIFPIIIGYEFARFEFLWLIKHELINEWNRSK